MFDYQRIKTDLLALGLLAATVFLALSLFSFDPADPPARLVFPASAAVMNLCGKAGAMIAHSLRTAFGLGSYLVLISLIILDARLFRNQSPTGPFVQAFGWMLMLVSVCIGFQSIVPAINNGPMVGSGGYVGAWSVVLLDEYVSTGGTFLLTLSMFTAGTLLTTDVFLFRLFYSLIAVPVRLFNRIGLGLHEKQPKPKKPRPAVRAASLKVEEPVEEEWEDAEEEREPIKVNPPTSGKSSREEIMASLDASSLETEEEEFEFPDMDLLDEAEEFPFEILAKKAQIAAKTLEMTFEEFGLNIRVTEIDTGPVITLFELELEKGLRVSKVTALADDLAIALRVPAVRIVSPIPGRNTVGVEVPNEKRVMVRLKELIESSPEALDEMRIPLFLGKDVSGHPLVIDMAKMPHLLIAGRTGTGKSVCLNTLILSILMTRSPEEVKMLMIDPKMVELSPYKRIPHLMHPVITDMKKAEAVLAWAVDKMEERYELLASCGVRHLDEFNKLGKEKILQKAGIDPDSAEADQVPERMPYIVIVADEMADMMMTSGKDVEGHIIRLAQKSRAVGIHLVLATQKPTVDVITGLIKSNLPARISFQVASRTDSRVVLDEMGAERLLGNGDMLYLAPGTSNVSRAQGTYVSGDEVDDVIEFFSDIEPEYNAELTQLSTSTSSANGPDSNRIQDEHYDEAIEIVIREGRGSVSLLQRCLGIGYGRAARLVDYMAEDGIVGEYNGSQAREVIVSQEQWDAMQAGEQLEDAFV